MKIQNQSYQFVPPGGDPANPIRILGLQEYSPGQSRKTDVWLLKVPEAYRHAIPDGTECESYGAVLRFIARIYFDGDDAKAKSAISS